VVISKNYPKRCFTRRLRVSITAVPVCSGLILDSGLIDKGRNGTAPQKGGDENEV